MINIHWFRKNDLITNFFRQAFNLIQNKEHLTIKGLTDIVAIKASMYLGLLKELKTAFPDITPKHRFSVLDKKVKDPFWLASFTAGEGCFL